MARIPGQLGPLTLTRQIGIGRHCQVWEASDATSGERVAVKVAMPEVAKDAEQRQLMRHERDVSRQLDHPGVIRIERFSTAGGLPHLVMELFPHGNLKKQVAAGTEAMGPRVQGIVTDLAWALDHMHSRGWVHRDLKPENILASPAGDIKLVDLGIAARKAGFVRRMLPFKSRAQGSPSYIAPEQIRGLPIDPRSDIYSLGCVLFELLAGKAPFTASSREDLLHKHLFATPPGIESFNPKVTSAVSRFLQELLAKRPADRPQTMRDVVQKVVGLKFFNRTGR
jgi:serine/threonine protein kinase